MGSTAQRLCELVAVLKDPEVGRRVVCIVILPSQIKLLEVGRSHRAALPVLATSYSHYQVDIDAQASIL